MQLSSAFSNISRFRTLKSCHTPLKFNSSPLLGQPPKPSAKKSVLEGDVDSAEDLSVSCGKGRVPGRDRATRMTVKASKYMCIYVLIKV